MGGGSKSERLRSIRVLNTLSYGPPTETPTLRNPILGTFTDLMSRQIPSSKHDDQVDSYADEWFKKLWRMLYVTNRIRG